MKYLLVFFTVFSSLLYSQEKLETVVEIPAHPIGGLSDIDYVFQSQLICLFSFVFSRLFDFYSLAFDLVKSISLTSS